MRIIAGTFRSRTLDAPPGLETRPTSDRLRETLFNVLAPRIQGARFLDLYAGSGAVGIEALSRGAVQVEFVEKAPGALKVLRANLAKLGIAGNSQIDACSVAGALKRLSRAKGIFELIFLDPPYDAADEYETALRSLEALLAPGGLAIAEHRRKVKLNNRYGALERTRLLEQGDASLSFYAARLSAIETEPSAISPPSLGAPGALHLGTWESKNLPRHDTETYRPAEQD
jgi:16S rRNA (guanine(966)-N(2))-methyltransferase RsmD